MKNDMGDPVNGYESPWGTAQFQMIYDSAKYNVSELPQNFAQFQTWVMPTLANSPTMPCRNSTAPPSSRKQCTN